MTTTSIETIGIIGAGTMGAQIGLHCAVHGYAVQLFSRTEKTLHAASQSHTRTLEKRLHEQQISADEKEAILGRIQLTIDMQAAVADADLVIENAPEDLQIKRQVFAQLDQFCPGHTILATDSSSLRISQIEDATQRRDKVLNMHFFQPPWQRPVVEMMRGTATSDTTMAQVDDFARRLGMVPLHVQKESTGFIFNRVWRAIKKECLHLVDQGVASHEDVDRAWMVVLQYPIGPFGIMDLVGLDVVRDIEMVYCRESGDERDAPPQLLLDKIARGELGVKTGKGFYSYPNPAFQAPDWLKGDPA